MTPSEPEGEVTAVNVHKEMYEWIQCIVVALICCVIIFVFLARVIDVKGTSMLPNLVEGDKIIITRLAGDYKQGEIVVLRKESFRADPIVKRIIATGGQTIDIDFVNGIVYVDGEALDEPYINERTYEPEDFEYLKQSGDYEVTEDGLVVPDGFVFVMGDNRNNSSDSRRLTIGCVDERFIMGKAVFRILPFSKIGAIYGWEY